MITIGGGLCLRVLSDPVREHPNIGDRNNDLKTYLGTARGPVPLVWKHLLWLVVRPPSSLQWE